MTDPTPEPPQLDHLVYAVPDLAAGIDDIAARLGVRPVFAGRHDGLGTANAILSIGYGAYLEVIGPDPEQDAPAGGRPFGVDPSGAPRLFSWAVRTADLDALVEGAHAAGYDPGPIIEMHRTRPDGQRLDWRLTVPGGSLDRFAPHGDGLVPFLIDWKRSAHPAKTAPSGCRLMAIRAEHPTPNPVLTMLDAVRMPLRITFGPLPRLLATLNTPNGAVTLY